LGTAIGRTAIDTVLRDAVDSGEVPHVATIAAGCDGVIYQGSGGLRAAGQNDPVTVGTLPFVTTGAMALYQGSGRALYASL